MNPYASSYYSPLLVQQLELLNEQNAREKYLTYGRNYFSNQTLCHR